jgi:hypothetical protein
LNVGESFPYREFRRTLPARRAQTIVQAASLFNQLLQHFPRTEFAALVKKHGAERAAKGFTCWTQFVAMLFCQLGRADSLRDICNGLACCLGRLVHVGIAKAPSRSTLSYANEHRPAALFEELFWTALARFREQQGLGSRKHKFRFKNKLLSLDSTTISLCLTMFPWARFRRAKGGVKAHVLLDHDDYLPAYVLLTEAKRSDVKLADSFTLNPGSIVTMDRGYTDYALFGRWTLAGVFFVTRMKDNAVFTIVSRAFCLAALQFGTDSDSKGVVNKRTAMGVWANSLKGEWRRNWLLDSGSTKPGKTVGAISGAMMPAHRASAGLREDGAAGGKRFGR